MLLEWITVTPGKMYGLVDISTQSRQHLATVWKDANDETTWGIFVNHIFVSNAKSLAAAKVAARILVGRAKYGAKVA